MSLWHIAWSYLWNRKLTTIMTILSVALAVGLISAVLIMREETRKRFEEEGDEFDMVIGAKGAPLQLVLSAVYFLDAPTGNIHMSDLEAVREDDRVKSAYPVCLGDAYQGTYRIVGTERGLMDHVFERTQKTPFKLAEGRYFEKPMEAVIGARVAEETGLMLDATFFGTHGFVKSESAHVHEAHPYTVVGILDKSETPNDRAIFCDMASVWDVHAHDPVDGMYEEDEGEGLAEEGVFKRPAKTPLELAEGRFLEKPTEAVIGARVAEEAGLHLNDTFGGARAAEGTESAHDHEGQPFKVVGIFAPTETANDHAILCDVASVWDVHGHDEVNGHEEHAADDQHDAHADAHEHEGHEHGEDQMVTAILVTLKSPGLRFRFERSVNTDTSHLMAAVPIREIQKLYDQFLGMAKAVLLAIGYLVVVISALSILIGLYLSIIQRKRDLAVMRALGASAGEIFGAVIIEAFWVSVLGLVSGWFLGALVCWGLGGYVLEKTGFAIPVFTMTSEMVTAYSIVLLMGMVAGILPAWQAYRTDIARDLAEL
jgi:putative ABC transport system permease protein